MTAAREFVSASTLACHVSNYASQPQQCLQAKCEWKDGQAVVGSDAVRIISLVPHSIGDICSEHVAGCALLHSPQALISRWFEHVVTAFPAPQCPVYLD